MTVAELIDQLQTMPQDFEVRLSTEQNGFALATAWVEYDYNEVVWLADQ